MQLDFSILRSFIQPSFTSYILGINILSTIKILSFIEICFSFKMTDCIPEAYQTVTNM